MCKANQRILLFGGTFDPIHNGHLIICRTAAEKLNIEKIILIPSANPPHKQNSPITDAHHRMQMTKLAVQDDLLFEVSDCELQRQGLSYTLQTVRYFQDFYGSNTDLFWLIGADTINDLPGWYQITQLADACTITTAARPGFDLKITEALRNILTDIQIEKIRSNILATFLINISSTHIRQRIEKSLPIRYLLPESVERYIYQHRLYGAV